GRTSPQAVYRARFEKAARVDCKWRQYLACDFVQAIGESYVVPHSLGMFGDGKELFRHDRIDRGPEDVLFDTLDDLEAFVDRQCHPREGNVEVGRRVTDAAGRKSPLEFAGVLVRGILVSGCQGAVEEVRSGPG